MSRLNLVLLLAVLASALYLVHMRSTSRAGCSPRWTRRRSAEPASSRPS
jgi:cell division protein FtsL